MRSSVPERSVQIEHADLSLVGNREENQDRVAIAGDDDSVVSCSGRRNGRARGRRAGRRGCLAHDGGRVLGGEPAVVRPGRVPSSHVGARARGRGRAWPGSPARHAAARNLRCVPDPGIECLLGAHRRQPRVPDPQRRSHRSHARSQPCRAAAARRPHHRDAGGGAPDAQLRRMLHRRGSRPAGDESLRPPRAAVRRHPAAVLRRFLDRARGSARSRASGNRGRAARERLQDSLADLGERAVQATAPLADNTTAAAVRWSGA